MPPGALRREAGVNVMELGPFVVSLLYQGLATAAFLILCSIGLMIVLGMMNIINLAHGEIMMIGAYVSTILVGYGIPFFVTLPICFVAGCLVGLLIEQLFVRFLYDRLMSALVVTWGLGLILAQGALLIFGPFMPSIKSRSARSSTVTSPSRCISYSDCGGVRGAVRHALAVALDPGRPQGAGNHATAEMARAIGIDQRRMYSLTFAFGTGLAAFAGGALAPTTTIAPFMGAQFVAPAFITVVVGGTYNIITGTLFSAGALAAVKTPVGHVPRLLRRHRRPVRRGAAADSAVPQRAVQHPAVPVVVMKPLSLFLGPRTWGTAEPPV